MSENNKIPFSPVRGYEENIRRQAVADGYIYFATDTGNIYVDAEGERHTMGGSGSSGIHYTNASDADVIKVSEDSEDKIYTIPLETFENPIVPKPDDLLLNVDGRFFRVVSYDSETGLVTTSLIAVSGSGSGNGGTVDTGFTFTYDSDTINNNFTFIEGKAQYASFIATSQVDSQINLQFSIYASWAAYNNGNGTPIKSFSRNADSGDQYYLDMSEFAAGSGLVLRIIATEPSTGARKQKIFTELNIVPMSITKFKENNFIGITYVNDVAGLILDYVPYGAGLTCVLHASVDNAEINVNKIILPESMGSRQSVGIPVQSHGMHTVAL